MRVNCGFKVAILRVFMMLVSLLTATLLQAQEAAQSARRIAPQPVTRIVVQGAEQPIELRTLAIQSDIDGRLAQTTVDMIFYNPNRRVLEGELQFPLQNGQTITGFALSMGEGKQETMREAVPVAKVKGRQVFENVIQQKIDPALLEVTQGNQFKLRVYPLNPGQTRHVRLTYSERLPAQKSSDILYRLPLAYAERIREFHLSVRVNGVNGTPVVANIPSGLSLDFKQDKQSSVAYIADLKAQDLRLADREIQLSMSVQPQQVFLGERDGKSYFYAEVAPPVEAMKTRAEPRSLALLWDASLSGQKRDHAKEFAFLDAFFARYPDINVRLQVTRDVAEAPQTFDIRAGNWRDLRKTLESMVYDGATHLGAFDVKTSADLFFLFSDGLDNYSPVPLTAPKAPLYALVSAPGAEVARLTGLARQGGALIDLGAIDARKAVERVMQSQPHVVAVEGDGLSRGDVVWRASPDDGAFIIAGVVNNPALPARVVFADANGKFFNVDFPRLAADNKRAESSSVPLLWAAMKIGVLEEEYELNRGEIRRLGKTFRLPTRETSLIVLDRVEDYVINDLEPPAELRDAYDRLRASGLARARTTDPGKIARVLSEWQAREAWWNKDYPKDNPFARAKEKTDGRDSVAPQYDRAVAEPPPPPAMAMAVPSSASASPPPPMDDIPAPASARVRRSDVSADSAAERPSSSSATIALRPWTPDAPYIARMQKAQDADLYRIYLDERPDFADSVAFYLDVAEQLNRREQKARALRVLSNLAEMNLESRHILRVLGYRLLEMGESRQAVLIFKRVLDLADDEPQSYRDLGLAHAAAGEYQAAIDRLYDVVERAFPRAFPGIEVIALTEMNAILETAPASLDTKRIDSRFIARRPLDLRVVLTWDADNTDIDLHVIDPNGEEAFYSHPLSYQGGRVSPDNTTGYGPEEFTLKIAKPGQYRVEVNFFGHRQQAISEATTIQLHFFTHYATRQVKKESVTMRLKEAKDRILVGEFEVR